MCKDCEKIENDGGGFFEDVVVAIGEWGFVLVGGFVD